MTGPCTLWTRVSRQSPKRRGHFSGQRVGKGTKWFSAGFFPQKSCFHPFSWPRDSSQSPASSAIFGLGQSWLTGFLSTCHHLAVRDQVLTRVLWGILTSVTEVQEARGRKAAAVYPLGMSLWFWIRFTSLPERTIPPGLRKMRMLQLCCDSLASRAGYATQMILWLTVLWNVFYL